MLKFKQFIYEMPTLDAHHVQELEDGDIKPPGKFDREDSVGDTEEHEIVARSWKDPEERFPAHHYLAVNNKTDRFDMSTRGGTTEDDHFITNETKKHSEATISAPEFYKAILRSDHAPKGLQSGGSQSYGGRSIWERLHKDPEVTVTHHDAETGKEIKLHTGDDFNKNYDQKRPTYFRARLRK